MFDSFVRQSGVPLVSVKLACAKGDKPTLVASQRRYKPIGSKLDPHRTWTLPMCVRWSAGNATGRDCGVVSGETGHLALSAPTCPDWVLPNDGELGYYRALPEGKLLGQLLAHARSLTLAERVGLVGDINGLVDSGEVPADVSLKLVADLAKDGSQYLVGQSIGIVVSIDEMFDDKLRPNYERFVNKLFAGRAKAVGWHSRPGEDDNAKQLRPQLLAVVANHGRDQALIAKATELTWKWLDDHKAIEPELVKTTLEIAGRYGDQRLFDRMHADAKATQDRDVRGPLLGALRRFLDPKIVQQARTIALSDELESRDAFRFVYVGYDDPGSARRPTPSSRRTSTRSRTSCHPRGGSASPTGSRGCATSPGSQRSRRSSRRASRRSRAGRGSTSRSSSSSSCATRARVRERPASRRS